MKWGEYECMFGEVSKEDFEIMNKFTPSFFYVVQNSIFESVVLGICRLIDSEKSYGKRNLSLFQLPDYVDEKIELSIKDKLKVIKEKSKSCIDWRNRWIAHKDFDISMKKEKLKDLSRNDINTILKELENLLEIIQNHYFNSSISLMLIKSNEGNKILRALKKSLNR